MAGKYRYQEIAAHLAAQSAPDAPKDNNMFQNLVRLHNKLNYMTQISLTNPKVVKIAENLLKASGTLLRHARNLKEAADSNDQEKTRLLLNQTAVAAKEFDGALDMLQKVVPNVPQLLSLQPSLDAFGKAKYKGGKDILAAAGVSVQELKEEDIKEIEEELDEDKKEEIVINTKFIHALNQEEEKKAEMSKNDIGNNIARKDSEEEDEQEAYVSAEDYMEMEGAPERPLDRIGWTDQERNNAHQRFDPRFLEQPTEEKSWKNYRLLHLLNADPSNKDFEKNLAKAIVASFYTKAGPNSQRPFSLDRARTLAKDIMKTPVFKGMVNSYPMVRKCLNGDQLHDVCMATVNPFSKTPEDQSVRILNSLKNMVNKMDGPEGKSEEWRNLLTTLKTIDPYADKASRERKMLEAFNAAAACTKGKKSVRSTEEEQNSFNQTMDVLGTLAKANDYAWCAANSIVVRTNDVRSRPFHKHEYISLSDFGEDKINRHMNQKIRRESLEDIPLEEYSSPQKMELKP